jgi:hypothetical protein
MMRWWIALTLALAGCSDEESAATSETHEAGVGGAGGSAGVSSGATGGASGASGGDGGGAGVPTGGSSGSSADAGLDSGPSCALTASGPITTSADGQVIELFRIESTSGAAIAVRHRGVVIRNVEILHSGGPGIEFSNADDLLIENVSVEHTGAPASGPNASSDSNNISGYQSARPQITNVRLTRGSSGIYLVECNDSLIRFVEGHDFRGPFPRGQLVQWDKSNNGVLEDFSVVNPAGSWPEDNVNVYQSTGAQIRRGLVDGNNSPSGVGVIFDGGFSSGVVEDVDALHMGNGCFSDYDGADGNVFRRTRCRDNICTDQGRGAPLSNALMWSGNPNPAYSQLRIEQSAYYAACNPGNLVWPSSSFELVELVEVDFTPRAAQSLSFCWEP